VDARRDDVTRHALAAAAAAVLAAAPATAQVVVPRPPIHRPPVIVVPGAITTTPAEYWGAIAYHRATGAHGYSYDFPSSREASVAALDACGNTECVVVASFKGGCGLLMDGPTGPSFAEGATAQEAQTKARLKCTDPQCQVIAWSCTR
jgi:hypothetical protein